MTQHHQIIRQASAVEIPEAAKTLSAAFLTYPWTRWIIPESDYETRLNRLQTIYLEHAVAHGIVLVNEHISAVAAILPPGCPEPGEETQSQIAELIGERLGWLTETHLPARLAGSWDFATLGVRPAAAGQGLGSSLIAEVLRLVKGTKYPQISLETSSPKNVVLYERHGFSVAHHTKINGGPEVYTMDIRL